MMSGTNTTPALGLVIGLAVIAANSRVHAETVLAAFGPATQWRYLDDGSDQGTAWREPDFDDQAWQSGPAPLGYGDPEIETRVSFGQDPRHKRITTYFRHSFDIGATDGLQQLVFRIRSDDGVVVYLNGKEVLRINMPAGEIGGNVTALQSLNDVTERLCRHHRIPATCLRPGKNLVAVEVHQVEPASSDLFLDLELRAFGAGEEFRPVVAARARRQTETFLKQHRIAPGQRVEDGYMDGGRAATIGPDGLVSSHREVIVVDRSRDELLKKHLALAGSEPLKALPPLDRAAVLAVYVNRVMTHTEDRAWWEAADRLLVAEYHGEPLLLGDVPRLCGSGVCRHRALLYKLLCDEAGLAVALVRGGFDTGQNIGPHAWNELHLEDGQRLIVDTMGLPPLSFPNCQADPGRRYFDVGNAPIYRSPPKEPVEKPIAR